MTRPAAKGWCPGAYQPMMSGDGLVVRVRPIMARLTEEQTLGLCDLAQKYGSGLIDLTSRANLQIRGVCSADHEALLAELNAHKLLPDDPDLEARRNILITPFWRAGDLTDRLAQQLYARLVELPQLPAKFGFAIDTGPAPLLRDNSADIRLERCAGGLLLRADGSEQGRLVPENEAITAALQMTQWFADTGGQSSRRMATHLKSMALPSDWGGTQRPKPASTVTAGPNDIGTFYGAPFGQIEAENLAELVKTSGCAALRVTPWRLILTENAAPVPAAGFVTSPNDPLLAISACPGAPLCTSASVKTRSLARLIAGRTNATLHISGCNKGCAHPRRSDVTLVGRDGRFDLVKNGLPWDEPSLTGLSENELADNDLLDRIGEF